MLAALLLLLAELKAVGRPKRMLPNSVFLARSWWLWPRDGRHNMN
jgi:hypothetical protein